MIDDDEQSEGKEAEEEEDEGVAEPKEEEEPEPAEQSVRPPATCFHSFRISSFSSRRSNAMRSNSTS